VPLSADAEGSLGIKPCRDVNAAAHGGECIWETSKHPEKQEYQPHHENQAL